MDITAGAWGWQHKAWENGVYYPDDLPEDWQLSYYSNEFNCVVVPADYWQNDGFGAADWFDDVHEDFVFYIDWPFARLKDHRDYQLCADECRELAHKLGAVLIESSVWEALDEHQKAWFEQVTAEFSVFEYGEVHALAGYALVADDRHGMHANPLALLHSDAKENLRDLGKRLPLLCEQAQCKHLVLAGTEPEIGRLNEIKTLLNVLGF